MKRIILAGFLALLPSLSSAQVTGTRPGTARVVTGSSATATTADYDGLIVFRQASGNRALTLPACNRSAAGHSITAVDGAGNASSGTITLSAPVGSSVSAGNTITTNNGAVEVTCDGVTPTGTWVVSANVGGTGGAGATTASGVSVSPTIRGQNNVQNALGSLDTAIGTGGGGGGEPAWTVVIPSGGDDYNNIQNALNSSRKGVILSANESLTSRNRYFNVCRTITVPRNRVLVGTRTGMYWGGTEDFGWEQWESGPVLTCGQWFGWPGSSTNQFATSNYPINAASAQVRMLDNTTIEGFAINGQRRPGPDSNWAGWGVCLNGVNSKGATVRNMVILNCEYAGLFLGSARPSAAGSTVAPISQMQVIRDNTIWYDGTGLWFGADWPGGASWSSADIRVYANEMEIVTIDSMIFDSSGQAQIHDNRIEDAGGCMFIDGAGYMNIHGQHFNDQNCDLQILSGYNIQFVDNAGQDQHKEDQYNNVYGDKDQCWYIGSVDGLQLADNQCRYGKFSAYRVGSASTLTNVMLQDGPLGGTGVAPPGENAIDYPPLFRDRRTQRVLGQPNETLHFLTGSRWATAWGNSTGSNYNTIYCCGAASRYTTNVNN